MQITVENLTHTYNEGSPFSTAALKDVNLTVDEGDFFGIIGHTGSGKSTFVQHLNALIKVYTAEKKYKPNKDKNPRRPVLTVGDFDLTVKSCDFKALRAKVGVVFQYPEYQLFAETVYDDVAFGLKNFYTLSEDEEERAVREAISVVGLNYDEVAQKSPFELSGGQKRRVAIAGVIVTRPDVLVLDEPAAGLDPLGKYEIMQLLHRLHGDWCKTVIIVSHDMNEIAENCNRAAVFSSGRIVMRGTPAEIFTRYEELSRLGLDVPTTAKITNALMERGIYVKSDFTQQDFVEKLYLLLSSDRKEDNV